MRLPSSISKKSNDWVLQFINIVFLILLFFMINGVIAPSQQPDILPPVAVLSDAATPAQNALFIDRDGRMKFADREVSAAEFEEVLRLTQGSEDAPQAIVADRRLSANFLINFLNRLQSKGLPVPLLMTLRNEP